MNKIITLMLILMSSVTFADDVTTIRFEKLRPVESVGWKYCLIGTTKLFTGIALNYFDSTDTLLLEKMTIKNGVRDGVSIMYSMEGKEERVENYKMGIQDGEEIWYHGNGVIDHKGNMKNGKQDGEWVSYWESGNLREQAHYKNGVATGKVKNYDFDGNLTEEVDILNGEINGFKTTYTSDGKILIKKAYVNDEQHGDTYFYFGDRTVKEVYINGNLASTTVLAGDDK